MSELNTYEAFERAINRQLMSVLDIPLSDPTLFTLINGTDAAVDDLWAAQHVNKFKNHWYAAAAPTDPQAGMIWMDSDDGKVYAYYAAAWSEIVIGSGESFHPFLLFGG